MNISELLESYAQNSAKVILDKQILQLDKIEREFNVNIERIGFDAAMRIARHKLEQMPDMQWMYNSVKDALPVAKSLSMFKSKLTALQQRFKSGI